MCSLIKVLDKFQLGENNHIELKWNTESFEELMTHFYFQLVRTNDMAELRNKFKLLLGFVKYKADLLLLAKLTMNVRDLNGK